MANADDSFREDVELVTTISFISYERKKKKKKKNENVRLIALLVMDKSESCRAWITIIVSIIIA